MSGQTIIINKNNVETTLDLSIARFAKLICFFAVGIGPIYSYFLGVQTNLAIKQLILDFITESPSSTLLGIIPKIAVFCAVFDGICDTICVNPVRDADELIRMWNKGDILQNKTIKRALYLTLTTIAITCSFPAGAAVTAVPLASLAGGMTNKMLRIIVQNSSLGILTILGIIYYAMFNQHKLKKHVNEFIDVFENIPDFVRGICKDLLGFIEVLVQLVANASYRGILFAFCMSAVLAQVLNLNNTTDFAKVLMSIAGFSTVLITLFTRTLSTSQAILNKKYYLLTSEEISQAPGVSLGTIRDSLLSVIRTGSLILLLWSIWDESLHVKFACSTILGSAILMHSLYMGYRLKKKNNALAVLSAEELNIRNNQNIDETIRLITPSNYDEESRKTKLFDGIAATIRLHFLLVWILYLVNLISRFTRLISFYGFSHQLSNTLNWNLNNYQNLAVTGFAGVEVTKNDFHVFADSIKDTVSNIATSWKLQKVSDQRSHSNAWFGFFSRPFRAVSQTSPYSYSLSELEEYHNNFVINKGVNIT